MSNINTYLKSLLEIERKYPQRNALRYLSDKSTQQVMNMTFREFLQLLQANMNYYSEQFQQRNINFHESGTCALLGTSSAAYFICQSSLACMNLAPLTLSTRNAFIANQHLIVRCGAPVLFYSNEYKATAEQLQKVIKEETHEDLVLFQIPSFMEALEFMKKTSSSKSFEILLNEIRPNKKVDENSPLVALHTSGTTGIPKLVYLPGRMFKSMTESVIQDSQDHKESTHYVLAPLFHAAGLFCSVLTLAQGHTLVLPMEKQWPPTSDTILYELQQCGVTILDSVPFFLQQLAETIDMKKMNWNILSSLDRVTYGGALLPSQTAHICAQHNVNLVSNYGSTECGFLMHTPFPRDKNQGSWNKMQMNSQVLYRWELHEEAKNPSDNLYELIVLKGNPTTALNQSNTPEGDFRTHDLFTRDPKNHDLFTIQRRVDSLIVHITGEKTNPEPIEDAIENYAHDLVKRVCVVGDRRFCSALLVELRLNARKDMDMETIKEKLWDKVKDANQLIPKQSVISKNMILILDQNEQMPVSDKGSLKRKVIEQTFQAKIDELYANFETGRHVSTTIDVSDLQSKSEQDLKYWLLRQVYDLVGSTDIDPSLSLFAQGLDSLAATQFQNTVVRQCLTSKDVPPNLIYQISSIDRLAKYIYEAIHSEERSFAVNVDWQKASEDLFRKYSEHQRLQETREQLSAFIGEQAQSSTTSTANIGSEGSMYLLTGVTGSLGNFLLHSLLSKSEAEVKRVYCAIRKPRASLKVSQSSEKESAEQSWGMEKLTKTFAQRELDPNLLRENANKGRLIVFLCDLEDKSFHLGLTKAQYTELAMNVTHIIHGAWRMDFNSMVTEFEASCIRPTFALLQLATLKKPKQFNFISSISSCLNYPNLSAVPEEIHHNVSWAHPMGYGQSKLIGERLTAEFVERYRFLKAAQVFRVGQIMGDSKNGVWNVSEHYPLLLNASQAMDAMPTSYFGDHVDWVPVDYCARAIVELTVWLNRCKYLHVPVAHLVNPHAISFQEMMEYTDLHLKSIPTQEWLEKLKTMDAEKVPAVKLATFFENTFESQEKIVFKTDKTVAHSPTMHECPPVQKSWIQASIMYWKKIGFLKA